MITWRNDIRELEEGSFSRKPMAAERKKAIYHQNGHTVVLLYYTACTAAFKALLGTARNEY
jgi:hypothetical protein